MQNGNWEVEKTSRSFECINIDDSDNVTLNFNVELLAIISNLLYAGALATESTNKVSTIAADILDHCRVGHLKIKNNRPIKDTEILFAAISETITDLGDAFKRMDLANKAFVKINKLPDEHRLRRCNDFTDLLKSFFYEDRYGMIVFVKADSIKQNLMKSAMLKKKALRIKEGRIDRTVQQGKF